MANRKPKKPSLHYRANDEGGFGNPPVSGQFKGKPGPGRPRGGTTLATSIKKLLNEKVAMATDNGRVEISLTDALLRRLRKEMLTGSFKALELGLEWADKYGPKDEDLRNANYNLEGFSRDEKSLLRSFLFRMTRSGSGKVGDHLVGNHCGIWRVYERDDGYIGFEFIEKQYPVRKIDDGDN